MSASCSTIKSAGPNVEARCDLMLERSLQDDIRDLQLACTIRWNEDEMDARVLRAEEPSELLAFMHCPDIEDENDARVGGEVIVGDAGVCVGHHHLLYVFLHGLLATPVVFTEGEVHLGSD